jgi:hypothetical protein
LLGPSPNPRPFPDWSPRSCGQQAIIESREKSTRIAARDQQSGVARDGERDDRVDDPGARARGDDDGAAPAVPSRHVVPHPVETPLVAPAAREQAAETVETDPAHPMPPATDRRGRSALSIVAMLSVAILGGFLIGRYQPATSNSVEQETGSGSDAPPAVAARKTAAPPMPPPVAARSAPAKRPGTRAVASAVSRAAAPEPALEPPPITQKSAALPTVSQPPPGAATPEPAPQRHAASSNGASNSATTAERAHTPAKATARDTPAPRRSPPPAPRVAAVSAKPADGPIIIRSRATGSERTLPGAYVRLRVEAEAGSTVWVDGRSIGSVPIPDLFLEPGSYSFVARAPDGSTIEQLIDVAPGVRVVEF